MFYFEEFEKNLNKYLVVWRTRTKGGYKMNYIEQFLKDNNLEIGQKFRPKKSNCDIWFDDKLVMQGTSNGCKVIFLTEIMTGEFEECDNPETTKGGTAHEISK